MSPYQAVVSVQVPGRLTVLGDLHGKIRALEAILAERNVEAELAAGRHHLISVGDVVDRGPKMKVGAEEFFTGAEAVLDRIASLKERFPERVWMIIGNHEQQHLEDIDKRGLGPGAVSQWASQGRVRLTERRLDFLKGLPLVLRLQVGDTPAIVVHGGPPRSKLVLDEVRAEHALQLARQEAFFDIGWGNPAWSMQGQGSWHSYTKQHVAEFLRLNGASVLIRGHRDEDEILPLPGGFLYVSIHSAKGLKSVDADTDGYAYLEWDHPQPPRLAGRRR